MSSDDRLGCDRRRGGSAITCTVNWLYSVQLGEQVDGGAIDRSGAPDLMVVQRQHGANHPREHLSDLLEVPTLHLHAVWPIGEQVLRAMSGAEWLTVAGGTLELVAEAEGNPDWGIEEEEYEEDDGP